MTVAKEKQTNVRELNAIKEKNFLKSFRNEVVITIEEFKETQAVHPSHDRHGTMESGPHKTRPLNMSLDAKQFMARKASSLACANDEKYQNDSYSAHDMRAEEARKRGSQFQDLLIRPLHLVELDEKRKFARSSLYGGGLDIDQRERLPPENLKMGNSLQTNTKSFIDMKKSSVNFKEGRRKSSLTNAIAFNRTSIMHKRKGKSMLQVDEDLTNQARRESKMDAMGTCTHVKVRHVLSEKQGLITDVYNQLQKGWFVFGNKVPPKDFSKLAKKYSKCKSAKLGGDLGWVARAKAGTAGPFQEVAFTTPIGGCSAVFQSSQGFHILLVEARKN